jgi:two-component system, response regulator
MNEQPLEVLLVEDNPDDVELTLHVFKKHKLANHVTVMRDGAEALEFLLGPGPSDASRNIPKVILLDLKLPKVNGIEVLGKLKADPRTKSIPVVILTSSREERDLFLCYELGVNSYIVKPVDFAQFTEAIQQLGLYWLVLNEGAPTPSKETTRSKGEYSPSRERPEGC